MVPNRAGNYETCRQAAPWGSGNTVTGTVINADAFLKTDATARLFGCTATKIYEVTSSAVTDRSAGGGSYTSETMWNGAQYGDVTIYTGRANNVQASSSGAFAALAGTPPKAKYIATQSLAVALAAYNDGVNTYEDGVWISDIGDHTTWTPSASNEAANFRLLQTPGGITGLVQFKGDFLAFKEGSFYRMSYVGLPVIWQPRLVSSVVGASGTAAICVCDDVVIFGNAAGFYAFDGQTVQQIAWRAPISRNLGQWNPGGNGSCVFDALNGHAYLQVGGYLVFQAHQGPGFGFAGAFTNIYTTGGAPGLRSIIRGDTRAITTAIGLDDYSVAFFLVSSTNSAPYTFSDVWGSRYSAVSPYVQTSYFGDGQRKINFQTVTLMLGVWAANAFDGSMVMNYAERAERLSYLDDLTKNGTAGPTTDISRFTFGQTTRFAAFKLLAGTTPMEVEDILVPDAKPAGKF